MEQKEPYQTRTYSLKDRREFTVLLYPPRGNRARATLRAPYGHLEVYVRPGINLSVVDDLVNRFIKKNPGSYLTRNYMVKGKYAFVLGERKIYTQDSKLKNDSSFFYVPASQIPENVYKKRFLEYAYKLTSEKASLMGIDFSEYKVTAGQFISMYGSCCPSQKRIKFDYRLFAYKSEVFDAVITHELSHIIHLDHSKEFYKLVYRYCPRYDELMNYIVQGAFEGR